MVSWALKAVSELSCRNPFESSKGMRERRERATVEVLKSPIPNRSLSPPKDEPGGTTYWPGMKFSGPSGADQYPSTRVRTIQSYVKLFWAW